MEKITKRAKDLIFSGTAKDTYVLFSGNVASAFLGFLFTLLIARALSVEEFGVFSAAANLIVIVASLTDIGISSAIINFISSLVAKGKEVRAQKFLKAALNVRILAVVLVSAAIFLSAKQVSRILLATSDVSIAYWTAVIPIALVFWFVLPYALQGYRRFKESVAVDLSLGITRIVIAYAVFVFAGLTVSKALAVYAVSALFPIVVGLKLIGGSFLTVSPDKSVYLRLLKFSGWLGVNRIISSISGRLDITMLAALAGASATGLYSIPAKLAAFIVVLSSSFSSVLAPRFASFDNKSEEKRYLIKATLGILPIIGAIILWIAVAEPFILTLFGDKYLASVGVFRALAVAMIPFVLTAPSVTAIVYALKKPVYIGAFSFFQLAAIFTLNYAFIPQYGPYGPTISFGIVNTILAIYSWVIIFKYYFVK